MRKFCETTSNSFSPSNGWLSSSATFSQWAQRTSLSQHFLREEQALHWVLLAYFGWRKQLEWPGASNSKKRGPIGSHLIKSFDVSCAILPLQAMFVACIARGCDLPRRRVLASAGGSARTAVGPQGFYASTWPHAYPIVTQGKNFIQCYTCMHVYGNV